MQQVVKSIALSPCPNSSPPKRCYFRSLSPIAVQHGFKRKCKHTRLCRTCTLMAFVNLDDSDSACTVSAPKRPSWNGVFSSSEDGVWEPLFGYNRFRHRRSNGSLNSVVGPLDDTRPVFDEKKPCTSTSDDSCQEMIFDDAVRQKCMSESDSSDVTMLDSLLDSN
ncbi:unnamed protein product [Soboliphyme baturini]|uniref:Nuclear receptor domain-containing protein n=1 Tax=Soboliphyme baturini TaxID=241478 RepID=A0A183J777_9BILA|nr:unnamed protein product [Soboliphyme baturini]